MKGRLFLILGASGSGKGTVLSYLREKHPEFIFPVSCTTRTRRPGEREGDVYYFISREEFERRLKEGAFLEWALVHHQNYYGTLKKPILEALNEGRTVIREVDIQGLKSIKALVPSEVLTAVFLTVKDWPTLRSRILARSPMKEEELEERRQSYEIERLWANECDFVVESVEGQVDRLCQEVEKAILSQINA